MVSNKVLWSDDEVELLLSNFRVRNKKKEENVDWEPCQSKFTEIYNAHVELYPKNGLWNGKDFPYCRLRPVSPAESEHDCMPNVCNHICCAFKFLNLC